MKCILALLLLAPLAVVAQPVTEHVTVTGTRDREVLEKFVKNFAAPTRMTGKIARWETGVCPLTVGLKAEYTKFISERVRQVADDVGAPVNRHNDCKPNIQIVFTTKPQALLDAVRKRQPVLLGYADTRAQSDTLAVVMHPIQSWYLTATADLNGNTTIDSAKFTGRGTQVRMYSPDPPGYVDLYIPGNGMDVTGSRLGDGLHSRFYHVFIVAEPARLLDHEIGTLADYVALLALTQIPALDACQPLPSIVNLLAKECDQTIDRLSASDLAYLRGLYKMGPGRTLRTQEDEVVFGMQQATEGK